MKIVTRFAPSPTGFLHIGGARTALFNWLFAKNNDGKFLLRVEDTDQERSTQEAVDAILSGLDWLGLKSDEEPVYQSKNQDRHVEIANKLIKEGKAYYCYTPAEELEKLRKQAKENNENFRYRSPWREADKNTPKPDDVKPVVRLKADNEGEIAIKDLIQGEVTVNNIELDDMVILRSDGSPTYMLAVVVDDKDMGVTHVIRGDDHLTNSFRQVLIYKALGWNLPVFAHIPLIHGADGAKLSKRHGALSVESYKDIGVLAEAMINYLLRLGWSHGDEEIFSLRKATELFNLESIGKSPSRFDLDRLLNLNQHYIMETENDSLANKILPEIEKKLARKLNDDEFIRLVKSLQSLKQRSNNLNDLATSALFYMTSQFYDLDEKAKKIVANPNKEILSLVVKTLEQIEIWKEENIEQNIRDMIENNNLKFGDVGQPLRVILTGTLKSPGIFEVINLLGKDLCLKRINRYL